MVVMSSLWEQRAARNEALFREVNENIARLEEQYGTTDPARIFICECASDDCTEHLPVDVDTYRHVRENRRRFLVLAGHVDAAVERVVEDHGDYLIVEKTGAAGEIAEQSGN